MEVFNMNALQEAFYQSEIGLIKITGSEAGIEGVYFVDEEVQLTAAQPPDCLKNGLAQLEEYFRGKRQKFSLKLQPQGTDFQKEVWKQLLKIPYGRTVSYGDIAAALGDKNAVRAVGSANGKNPISIIVPCHRVIGSNGKLIGYGGGVWRKEWLLKHERSLLI
jgi:methylated-DNA-[protein]-cysteine S-methyltransferase